jgi:hypothetical protein
MSDNPDSPLPQPLSLTGHTVPADRLALIRVHVDALARTARDVSDELPLEADAYDFVRLLEAEEN